MYNRTSGLYTPKPTLRELYQSLPTLFNGMRLPASITYQDFSIFALTEYGDLETIFADGVSLAAYLQKWSEYRLSTWTRLEEALIVTYNPIHNYNMEEKETPAETTETITPAETTETITPAETTDTITPAETTETITPAETTTTNTPAETTVTDTPPEITDTGTQDSGIYGFNSTADASPANTAGSSSSRTVNNPGTGVTTVQTPGTVALTVNTAESRATTVQEAETVVHTVNTAESRATTVQEAETRVYTTQKQRTLTREGNIGVTTTQQMLESEVQLRTKYRILDIILEEFRREFCVGVW